MRLLGLPVAGVAGVAAVSNDAHCKQLLSQNCHSGPGPGSVASRKCYPDFNSWGKGEGYCKASKHLEPEPWGRSLGLNILRSPDYSNLGGTEQGPGLPPCVWPGSSPRCSLEACYKHAEFQAQKCLSPLPLVQPAFWRRMTNILEGRYVSLPLSFGWWVWGPWFVELVLSCMETVGSLRKKTFIKSRKENE